MPNKKSTEADPQLKPAAETESLKRFSARIFLFCTIVTGFIAAVHLAISLKILILDVLLALTFASAMTPLALWGDKYKIPRPLIVIATYLTVAAFYIGVGFLIYKPFREQIDHLIEQAPIYAEQIRHLYAEILDFAGDGAQYMKVEPGTLRAAALKLVTQTMSATAGILEFLVNAILVLFLSAFLLVESDNICTALLRWIPRENRAKAASLIMPLANRMGGYVRGQMLVSTAVAAFFATGFTLIGVKYGLVLGLLAGILNLIPFVGSMIATGLALFIAADQSMTTFALTLGLFIVEQGIESNFIVPYLLGGQVEMHPLVVLFAILTGATIAGAPGAIVAVPTVAAILLLAQEFILNPLNADIEAAPSAAEADAGT